MNRFLPEIIVSTALVWLIGCTRSSDRSVQETAETNQQDQVTHLTRDDALAIFKTRANQEEHLRLQRLLSSTNYSDANRALEMVLFTFTVEEMRRVGMIAQERPECVEWWIADTDSTEGATRAMFQVLNENGIRPFANCSLGTCSWSVPREEYFRARRALSAAATNLQTYRLKIIEPTLTLK